ncbi:hypothetical protein GGR57DRAFT_512950 [Xylariaceae sp. FL1272]|nr:hypothetical protein GGR57DRAFT_512950 [Xylariaceae sp. FL1272]
MSSHLERQSGYEATFTHNFMKQVFSKVPQIPADINLAGKTVLVTGSNVGIGLGSVRHFLKLNPSLVIMAVRSLEKGETAAAVLRAEFPNAKIEVWQLDMVSFISVQRFAARCEEQLSRIHIAVLNAGLWNLKFERCDEGSRREVTVQVNYLSTALLALLLIPKMRPTATSSEPSHLTIVNTGAALPLKIVTSGEDSILDTLTRAEGYNALHRYGLSKLFVQMFVTKLAEMVSAKDIIINCTDPGTTNGTAFFRDMDSWLMKIVLGILQRSMGRKISDASRIYIYSTAVLGEESHGSWTDWLIRAWPATMYTEHGRVMTEKLWIETLDELSFAAVDNLINKNM